jgi:hypothetical protein
VAHSFLATINLNEPYYGIISTLAAAHFHSTEIHRMDFRERTQKEDDKMRMLSNEFMSDLKNPHGVLHPILDRVHRDQTLMLAIRSNWINIYYRGGNILRIKAQQGSSYEGSFDEEYCKGGGSMPALPATIETQAESRSWVAGLPILKEAMDLYFTQHGKQEREFQQLAARENNYSSISNETEYFVSDIEFSDPHLGARVDMLAIRWLASHRKNGSNCRAVLIEMKYGDKSLGGGAGLLKHLEDMEALITDVNKWPVLVHMMKEQFNQLDELGLLDFNKSADGGKVDLLATDRPQVVLLLANHNPRSTILDSILNDPRLVKYAQATAFDLRFAVIPFAGYGLHADCMLTRDELKRLTNCRKEANTEAPSGSESQSDVSGM